MNKYGLRFSICVGMMLLQAACITQQNYAPIDVANDFDDTVDIPVYHVRAGDTLYSIAWRYDLDYRQLAHINHLVPPYALNAGQSIAIHPEKTVLKPLLPVTAPVNEKEKTPGRKPPVVLSNTPERQYTSVHKEWVWPVEGNVKDRFAPQQGLKGINITIPVGTQVRAAAKGCVAYAGSGLRAYGNLLIIKHNDRTLSAYAYNRKLLVKEGDFINAGQPIAISGAMHQQMGQLHFEIRVDGKPVDPLLYLPRANS